MPMSVGLKAHCHDITSSYQSKLSRRNSYLSLVTKTNQKLCFAPSLMHFVPFIPSFFGSIGDVRHCAINICIELEKTLSRQNLPLNVF